MEDCPPGDCLPEHCPNPNPSPNWGGGGGQAILRSPKKIAVEKNLAEYKYR